MRPGDLGKAHFGYPHFQKQIARSILNLSSAAITPVDVCSKRLSEWRDGNATKITAMPVFSNVGEPGCGSAPCARLLPLCSVSPGWKMVFLAFIVQKSNASF
jgi:hypothetical protein